MSIQPFATTPLQQQEEEKISLAGGGDFEDTGRKLQVDEAVEEVEDDLPSSSQKNSFLAKKARLVKSKQAARSIYNDERLSLAVGALDSASFANVMIFFTFFVQVWERLHVLGITLLAGASFRWIDDTVRTLKSNLPWWWKAFYIIRSSLPVAAILIAATCGMLILLGSTSAFVAVVVANMPYIFTAVTGYFTAISVYDTVSLGWKLFNNPAMRTPENALRLGGSVLLTGLSIAMGVAMGLFLLAGLAHPVTGGIIVGAIVLTTATLMVMQYARRKMQRKHIRKIVDDAILNSEEPDLYEKLCLNNIPQNINSILEEIKAKYKQNLEINTLEFFNKGSDCDEQPSFSDIKQLLQILSSKKEYQKDFQLLLGAVYGANVELHKDDKEKLKEIGRVHDYLSDPYARNYLTFYQLAREGIKTGKIGGENSEIDSRLILGMQDKNLNNVSSIRLWLKYQYRSWTSARRTLGEWWRGEMPKAYLELQISYMVLKDSKLRGFYIEKEGVRNGFNSPAAEDNETLFTITDSSDDSSKKPTHYISFAKPQPKTSTLSSVLGFFGACLPFGKKVGEGNIVLQSNSESENSYFSK